MVHVFQLDMVELMGHFGSSAENHQGPGRLRHQICKHFDRGHFLKFPYYPFFDRFQSIQNKYQNKAFRMNVMFCHETFQLSSVNFAKI